MSFRDFCFFRPGFLTGKAAQVIGHLCHAFRCRDGASPSSLAHAKVKPLKLRIEVRSELQKAKAHAFWLSATRSRPCFIAYCGLAPGSSIESHVCFVLENQSSNLTK